MNDGAIFGAYEFCYFIDYRGNPPAYSASILRDALSNSCEYRGTLISAACLGESRIQEVKRMLLQHAN